MACFTGGGRRQWLGTVLGCVLATGLGVPSRAGELGLSAEQLSARAGIAGGLCVQLGADDMAPAVDLARTGRFLVRILDARAESVDGARRTIHEQNLDGLVSVDSVDPTGRLPFTENLVNLLIVRNESLPREPSGIVRVLCPGGVVLLEGKHAAKVSLDQIGLKPVALLSSSKNIVAGRKPWPAEMDSWPHPRHAADGNAVSNDLLVGPPRRIRWVAGPFQEIANMVSDDGRNYYGGLWTRDAFNGLKLWQQSLNPSPARGGFGFGHARGSIRPIAAGELLFVTTEGEVRALDGANGKVVHRYPEAGQPADVLHVDGRLLAIDGKSIRALDVPTGRLCWTHEGPAIQFVVAGPKSVFFLQGSPRRGEKPTAVCLELADGTVRWQTDDLPWTLGVRRIVCHDDLVAFEVSTLNDDKEGNTLHLVSAVDGKPLWSRTFVPSMNHMKQARALFVGPLLWVMEDRKCVALDPQTGEEKHSFPAGLCHCFPPVATLRYALCGEMEMTNLETGVMDANRITKAACGRDFGWMPANGLIYVAPKHCVCWPMLRGYAAMAPERTGEPVMADAPQPGDFLLEKGVDPPGENAASGDSWPCYRRGSWRSGSTNESVPAELKTQWTAELGGWPEGAIAEDWRENPFIDGPVTPPVVAGGMVYVARTDAHQVVALDADTGKERWRYTASGRVDTAPTIHRGLCLFGTKSGWVYCLRADDGRLVWRLRAAPNEEQIVAYGQIESPWPVPGSVLVVDDVAYFAAGRQPLADGGVLVFAVEPATGAIRWVRRLDSVPTKNFYGSSGLEFDNFDLLHREGDAVAMSRWMFDRSSGEMTCKAGEAFARLQTDDLELVIPRRCWTYAPRHQTRFDRNRPADRPLVVFRGKTLLGCGQDQRTIYRRDFDAESVEKFDIGWITGWAAGQNTRKPEADSWRSERLARGAAWSVPVFADDQPGQRIAAMVWAGDTLLAAGLEGGLVALSAKDGKELARCELPAPVWDGMAAAGGRVFVTTQAGGVICLGAK